MKTLLITIIAVLALTGCTMKFIMFDSEATLSDDCRNLKDGSTWCKRVPEKAEEK